MTFNPLLFSNFNLTTLSGCLTFLILIVHNDYFYYKNLLLKVCSQVISIFSNHGNQLEFVCTETHRNCFGISNTNMSTSDSFKAICLYIKKKINNGKTKNLFKLKELTDKLYDNYADNLKEILYIASQNEIFTLNDVEDQDIYFQIKKSNLDLNNNQKNETISGNNYTLIVSSQKKSLQYLQNYVENILKEYYKIIEYQLLEKEYVFIFEGSDNEGNLNFSSYPFTTTSSFDNFYHPDKQKIMNQIDFFKNNKDWYHKRGKPYTLGICTWGTPGCGKTTFEKIVTNYLKRHLIIVDFSRIKNQREADLIFFSEKINNIIIPYEKRIYCFPDVDRMTDILKEKNQQSDKNMIKEKNDLLSSLISDKIDESKPSGCSHKSDSPLNLSKILNILDGIPERTGQIIMMSCNHPEKLDKAFLRPGRIDILTEFKKINFNDLLHLISNYYEISIQDIGINFDKKDVENKWTPAECFKICSQNKHIQECLQDLINQNPEDYIFPF